MLGERDAQLDGEENSCGQKAIWRHVYDSMKCISASCHSRSYCWLDSVGKKLCRLHTQTLRCLVTYAERGGVLETYKDIPDEIREELYTEKQQRLEKEKRKSGNILGAGAPYSIININVLPSQSHPPGLDTTASKAAIDSVGLKEIGSIEDSWFQRHSCQRIWCVVCIECRG